MAWNPDPKIAMAREFGKKVGARQVFILYVTDKQMGCVTYGKTRALCDDARHIGDKLYEALSDTIMDLNESDEGDWT